MDLNLKGQSVVIFGGAGTIGQAVVRQFLAEGCEVMVLDTHPALDVVTERIPGNCMGHRCDVTDFDEVKFGLKEAQNHFGAVHHVIFTVGVGSGKFGFPFWNLDPSDWNRVMQINLQGAVHAAHAFAPYVKNQRSGSMTFFTSVAGQMGSQTDPPYSAAKAGLINFMQCVAKDFAPFRARANAISPGMVQSELNRSVWQAGQELLPEEERQEYEDWAEKKIRQVSPLGEWQKPDDFGAMAVYLSSNRAQHITGQVLNIDGGQIMHA